MKHYKYLIITAFSALICGACTEKKIEPEVTPKEVVVGEAVDLGLSVKWADHNVGAAIPQEAGDFFAWGETEPKSYYDWNTYKHCGGTWNTINKYNDDSYYGSIDHKTVLESQDDAATTIWGADWRMPTAQEMEELRTHCTWTRTNLEGVAGYIVKSMKNDNSIFLPAAGFINENRLSPGACYYWTSTVQLNNMGFACRLYHNVDGTNTNSSYRVHGMPVRPVSNK